MMTLTKNRGKGKPATGEEDETPQGAKWRRVKKQGMTNQKARNNDDTNHLLTGAREEGDSSQSKNQPVNRK